MLVLRGGACAAGACDCSFVAAVLRGHRGAGSCWGVWLEEVKEAEGDPGSIQGLCGCKLRGLSVCRAPVT